ncbi:ABC transporter permease [Spirochaetia bacterium]|nr:ABC transporter permease [Spirochaetia bacterium]
MVMKIPFGKTYVKTIIREIRGSIGRFLAIFAIVALGVGFLAGLLATTPDMKLSADRYFDQTRMMDIFIKGTMGLTEDDVQTLRNLDAVETLLPAYVTDTLVRASTEEVLVSRIYGLPLDRINEDDFLNRMELIAGRMPERIDECLIQQPADYLAALPIGMVLTILDDRNTIADRESDDTVTATDTDSAHESSDTFSVKTYTVTGIVKSPLFISYEREPSAAGSGQLGAVIYISDRGYALPVYTDFFITLKKARSLNTYSGAYEDLVDAAAEKIKALGEDRSRIRRAEVLAEARETAFALLSNAEQEYITGRNTALAELAGARKKLDDAARKIADGEAELIEAEAELAEGEAEIADGRRALTEELQRTTAELRDNEAALERGEREIAAARRTLAESKAQLDAAKDEVERTRASRSRMSNARAREGVAQYDAGVAEYNAGAATVAENERELREGRRLLEEGQRLLEEGRLKAEAEFAAGAAKLKDAAAEIAAGWERLIPARTELADGEAEYAAERAKALTRLSEGEAELEEARKKIEEIEIDTPEWYVLDRNANVGYVSFGANAEKIDAVARVFPIFFLLVAALVALTTMTRMVEEERIQIGTLKALGYQKRVIAAKYLIYCGLTALLGSAVGMVLGFQGFPAIIYNAFGTRYHLPPLVTEFNWPFGLISSGIVLVCTMGATVSASYQALHEKPATLMLPRSPKPGKRIFLEYIPFIWTRMKFTYKVTARNLIRYKKHFIMTVTGIAGCTALMVTAFGLRDSMTNIAGAQYTDILQYDLRLELQEGIGWDPILTAFLEGNGARPLDRMEVHRESGYVTDGKERVSVILYVPRHSEALGEFITLRNRKTKTRPEFTDTAVIITEKAAEVLNARVGDSITVEAADGRTRGFPLTGITENYVGSFVYLGQESYRQAFGEIPSYPILLVRTGAATTAEQDEAARAVLSSDTVASAEFNSRTQESYTKLLASISLVALVLIAAAGGLAVIVLYNLTNININERSRELATLRVLGFHQGEAAAYIFREITILSIVGAMAGLLLGLPLHAFVISVAENPDLMFGRDIAPISFVLSAVITLLFSALVDLLMIPKIRNIRMADSMKAVD